MSIYDDKDPLILTRKDVAKQLNIGVSTLDRWVELGQFPKPIKLGSYPSSPARWKQSEIDKWVESLR